MGTLSSTGVAKLTPPSICPDCGGHFRPQEDRCWLCGWRVGDPIRERPRRGVISGEVLDAAPPAELRDSGRTFSLSSLFLWTTLLAAIMAIVRVEPMLGIGLAVLSLPISLLTVRQVRRRAVRLGHFPNVGEKGAIFLTYMWASFWVMVYAAIVLVALCVLFGLFGFVVGSLAVLLIMHLRYRARRSVPRDED